MSAQSKAKVVLTKQQMYDVILAPVITEKATRTSEHNQVVFRVALDATKPQIKAAIEGVFGVTVKAVNTTRVKGKRKLFRGRPGRALGLQEGDGHVGGWSVDRRDHGDLTMALKTYKPITPSLRELVLVDRSDLWKGKPVKALTEGLRGTGGRNNHGRITMWQRGGGHKQRYRTIDYKRRKFDVTGTIRAARV